VIEFVAGDQVVPFTVPATGSLVKYQETEVGTLTLPAGESEIKVRCQKLVGKVPCNIASVTLKPQ
jgi:hypothetical protein